MNKNLDIIIQSWGLSITATLPKFIKYGGNSRIRGACTKEKEWLCYYCYMLENIYDVDLINSCKIISIPR